MRSAAWAISGIWRGSARRPGSGTPSTRCVLTNASTTAGSNWMPANLRSSRERLLGGQRRHPVRPGGGHRLEGVGDVEDARELRDLVADEPVRVAGAVVPLVVVADDRQLRRQLRDRRDDLRAQHRVGVHDHPLVAGEPLRLQQDVVRHADLADVVEQAAPLERLELGVARRASRARCRPRSP